MPHLRAAVLLALLLLPGCAVRDNPLDPASPYFARTQTVSTRVIDTVWVLPDTVQANTPVSFLVTIVYSTGDTTRTSLDQSFDEVGTYFLYVRFIDDSADVTQTIEIPITVEDTVVAAVTSPIHRELPPLRKEPV